jgi:HSP20 family molecular chaperone IbpA
MQIKSEKNQNSPFRWKESIEMEERGKRKTWMVVVIVLSAICLVQGFIIVRNSMNRQSTPVISNDIDKFSFFLDEKYKKEKNESLDLFDQFFNDNFFTDGSDPFEKMEKLHRQMEERMSRNTRNRFNDSWRGWFGERFFDGSAEIEFDMKEEQDAYVLTINIPNLKENRINVNVEKDGIEIEGDFSQSIEKKDSNGNVIGRHQISQTVSKKLPIPDEADYSKATIDAEKNKITVRLPKKIS